jgi:hypothetical protein
MSRRTEQWIKSWGSYEPATKAKVEALVPEMRASGLIADRTYRLAKYPQCFVCHDLASRLC